MTTALQRLTSALMDSVGNAVYRIQVRAYGKPPELHKRSRRRWLTAEPDTDLTWGRLITGDAFVRKVIEYAKPTTETSILEIGPGYGRLLETWLRLEVPFKKYVGVDLSPTNVRTLAERFAD